jgi:hypothetical protein
VLYSLLARFESGFRRDLAVTKVIGFWARDEDGNLKGPATSQEVSQLPSSLKL